MDSPPQLAKTSQPGWKPQEDRHGEFLQVDLGVVEPIYGITTAGEVEHVTSYQVLYSTDNVTFSYVTLYDLPEVTVALVGFVMFSRLQLAFFGIPSLPLDGIY